MKSFSNVPMMVKDMGKEFVEKEMKGAFGIKIIPTEIFIKQKLSQNRKENDFKTSFHILNNRMIMQEKLLRK
jgi:transcriptional regulator